MSKLRQAELFNEQGHGLMLLGVRANGAVKGRLLAMSLEQRFRSPSDINTEITYTFPLPRGAVLMGVDVELNGKKLKGEVTAKSTARAKHEEASQKGIRASCWNVTVTKATHSNWEIFWRMRNSLWTENVDKADRTWFNVAVL